MTLEMGWTAGEAKIKLERVLVLALHRGLQRITNGARTVVATSEEDDLRLLGRSAQPASGG